MVMRELHRGEWVPAPFSVDPAHPVKVKCRGKVVAPAGQRGTIRRRNSVWCLVRVVRSDYPSLIHFETKAPVLGELGIGNIGNP